ncbi:NAD(P)/FAD-dependent oxidoreductase [Calothrix sp. 336/3]|uniref:NAD(P)/FAD-dependent oxidoreductase n=1 Tax=Calothrix sp. 336/3 TaxID=1337936 RepID=UPI0004E3051F|nr:FAD-binding oxidoreductase [Calothrix sp. 336/3]AKG20047.1 FAD-dependent oxidoreductase [Calothrix sp. 336/3]
MKIYDWIVIGAGITGAALAYELVKQKFSVLLLEQDTNLQNATHYSYGGLAFWSGNTPLTCQLCTEGKARYQVLGEELGADIELRELDLLLTIPCGHNPEVVATTYSHFATPPQLLTIEAAVALEPLLNPASLAGALTVKHGHIHPEKTAKAYIQGFLRQGGEMDFSQVVKLSSQRVETVAESYSSANIAICAGGLSRQLLQASGISLNLYFTHAEILQTPPVDIRLSTLVMPANLTRYQLEAESSMLENFWNATDDSIINPIIDVGAVQFLNNSLRIGQISRVSSHTHAQIDTNASAEWLMKSVANILPSLAQLATTWHHCLVAFSGDRLPLIGNIPEQPSIYIFSGFSNPLVFVPPLAQRFAHWVTGKQDDIISQLSPLR